MTECCRQPRWDFGGRGWVHVSEGVGSRRSISLLGGVRVRRGAVCHYGMTLLLGIATELDTCKARRHILLAREPR